MSHFNDKVAIVTGGGSGIGRALCEELGQRGAIVILADIDTERAQEADDSKDGQRFPLASDRKLIRGS